MAVLKDVFNYNEQDHEVHSSPDVFPDELFSYAKSGDHIYATDLVKVGAWLLQAVDAPLLEGCRSSPQTDGIFARR